MNAVVREVLNENSVRVMLIRNKECSSCDKCGICGAQGGEELLATAANPIGARMGDLVEVDSTVGSPVWIAFLVYALPCVTLILGYLLGQSLHLSEMKSVFFSMLGAVAGFLPAVAVNRAVSRRQTPEFVIRTKLR